MARHLRSTYRNAVLVVSAVAIAAVALSACSAKKQATTAAGVNASSASQSDASQQPSTPPAAEPALLTVSAATGAKDVNPAQPIKVNVSNGSLTTVSLMTPEGKAVKGAVAANKLSWASAEPLGYGKTYALTATATNVDGKTTTETRSFTTVQPSNLTMPYIQQGSGYTITPGATYGVGQVVKIHFDEAIPDRKAAQAALTVTTVPAQVGAFSWLSDQDVYWRTQTYMKSGTKVTITAKAYGTNFGDGLYGQADATTWFKVGAKHVSIADDNTKLVNVYENDKLVKTMPTSMGRDTTIAGDTGPIDLRTNSGPHVVIGGETNINMNSASFGLSKGANAYQTIVPVGVKISYDGEYVHWADWSVWAQGNTDTSHGCLNVSPDNAWWFYHFSVPGDIVDVRNTGRPLEEWNSGYWAVSWAKWLSTSAR
ncbi:L,D-transpeptidase [Jatrophihabitans sp. DSM 45814]